MLFNQLGISIGSVALAPMAGFGVAYDGKTKGRAIPDPALSKLNFYLIIPNR
jgi:hypothetical protein